MILRSTNRKLDCKYYPTEIIEIDGPGKQVKYDMWRNLTEDDWSENSIVKLEWLILPAWKSNFQRQIFTVLYTNEATNSLGGFQEARIDCLEVRFERII